MTLLTIAIPTVQERQEKRLDDFIFGVGGDFRQ
jgi:hypothetical protein